MLSTAVKNAQTCFCIGAWPNPEDSFEKESDVYLHLIQG